LTREIKIDIDFVKKALSQFVILLIDEKTVQKAIEFMSKYNLRPNDALIIATCKLNKIDNFVTLDSDFEKVCSGENIQVFS